MRLGQLRRRRFCSRACCVRHVFFPPYCRQKSVATASNCFDKSRTRCRIAERLTQLIHRRVQAVIEFHESIRGPQAGAQFFAAHDVTGTFEQNREDRERLLLQTQLSRSEERRVGKGGRWRGGWWALKESEGSA